jgi:DNA-binding transcriptional LysR family regulator
MIDLLSLKHFLVVARCQSLAVASEQLNLTPSAISKSLKRLEQNLQTTLFDREGRSLRLNSAGQHLELRAVGLIHNAQQLQSEFAGERHAFKCRITGPHILQLGWGAPLIEKLLRHYPKAVITYEARDDYASIEAVELAACDIGIVAIPDGGIQNAAIEVLPLGETEYRVALGDQHPLAVKHGKRAVHVDEVLKYDFVVPVTATFSNMENHVATDGWRDDVFPRILRYRTDDLLMMRELLSNGKALAYLPEYIVDKLGLRTLKISGCPYYCRQHIALIHRRSDIQGWIHYLSSLVKRG